MSDAHHDHEAGIRTPKQLIIAIAAGFLVPIIAIVLLVQYVTNTPTEGAGSDAQSDEAIVARIKPVADQNFTFKDVSAPRVLQTGSAVYNAVCAACHAAGVAGAPKFGDTAAWSARIAKGYDTLVSHAIKGINAMPAKGGNPDLDDVEVARAVAYMGNQAGAKFKEPEASIPLSDAAVLEASTAATAVNATSPVIPAAASTESAPSSVAPTATPVLPTAPTNTPAVTVVSSVTSAKLPADAGKKLYEAACQACHAAGIAGAPKFGDKAAWADRIKQGAPVLYEHAIKGFQGKAGVMPPKGGTNATDEEVKAAVDYMSAAAK